MKTRTYPLVVLSAVLVLVGSAEPQTVEIASVDSNESLANAASQRPAVSEDGRLLAFISDATNLVPGDTNAVRDVFVRDLETGLTALVSVGPGLALANGDCAEPSVSADGRYIAFESSATNLVPGDTNAVSDVFRHDRLTGQTIRVSVSTAGVQGDNESRNGRTISADGRWIAFYSRATNLVANDTNGAFDIFLRDVIAGTTTRVQGATEGNTNSLFPTVSRDGRYVALQSNASNFVPDDTNGQTDIFVWDRLSPTSIERVSLDSAGNQANTRSGSPFLSADGRFVVFDSAASNLVPNDTNAKFDVFVRDLLADTTERVSVSSLGVEGVETSHRPSISPNGRWIAFRSASSLVSNDQNAAFDVYLHDREDGKTTRISTATFGGDPTGASEEPVISGSLSTIAFASAATNLVSGDTNGVLDVFARVDAFEGIDLASVSTAGAAGDGPSFQPDISADGRFIAFWSGATNLGAGDVNGIDDIFVRDRTLGTTTLVSVDSSGQQANSFSLESSISDSGEIVVFTSWASNLAPGDTNGVRDSIGHDLGSGSTFAISVSSAGVFGNAGSDRPIVSGDGRFAAFYSESTNLVPDDTNGVSDAFLRDLQNGTTTRVSVDSAGNQGNGSSSAPVLSSDGRFIAFSSWADNLVANDTNGQPDVFVHDRVLGTTELISATPTGLASNAGSRFPSISASGQFVSFYSTGSDLVPTDGNNLADIFVRDRYAGLTVRASVSSQGLETNAPLGVGASSLSPDGRYVAFGSEASNLVSNDENGVADVFLHDLQSQTTTRLSVDGSGNESDGFSVHPALSACGRVAVFESMATNLASLDVALEDIFVREIPALGPQVETYCTAKPSSQGCVPRISYLGNPCSSCSESFLIRSEEVLNFKNGLFFYGFGGRAAIPFLGATLCVQPPLRRTLPQTSLGNPPPANDCSGSYTLNVNALLQSGVDPLLFAGRVVNGQYWYRDPANVDGTGAGLSDAIEFALCP